MLLELYALAMICGSRRADRGPCRSRRSRASCPLAATSCRASDHIVSFKAVCSQDRNTKRLADSLDIMDSGYKVIGASPLEFAYRRQNELCRKVERRYQIPADVFYSRAFRSLISFLKHIRKDEDGRVLPGPYCYANGSCFPCPSGPKTPRYICDIASIKKYSFHRGFTLI